MATNNDLALNDSFPLPPHFSIWEGDETTINLDSGELTNYEIMFKFAGARGWMHVPLMKFYPAATRSDRKPYHYEAMLMDGTKEKIDIQFDISKYSSMRSGCPNF